MGRELYAIGSNPDAATLAASASRARARRVRGQRRAAAWPACSAARFGAGRQRRQGAGVAVVAAVVVGGVAIFGGSGTVYGAALGALLLGCIGSALVILKVNQFWEQAIDGFLLLVAIGLDRLLALRVAAVLRKRSGRHAG
jgi:rhamnose transport system permease protein